MNLKKKFDSSLENLQNIDTLSVSELYDIKAYRFKNYFPEPPLKILQEDELNEERGKLGLANKNQGKKRISIQEEDELPRYEISKLQILAQIDLDETIRGNQDEADKAYGNAVCLGKEIGEEIKKEDHINRQEYLRRLASNRKTLKE